MSEPAQINATAKANGHMTGAAEELAVIRAFSALLDRKGWMTRAGLTFDGARNLWQVFGYKQVIQPVDMYLKYCRQDIAKTIVNAPADALWTNPPKINGSDQFQNAWNSLTRRVQVWDVLNRADKMTGWGRFSIIVIGLPGKSDRPVRQRVKLEDVLYLQPYSELGVEVESFVTDTANPRFGKPEMYRIRTNETDIDNRNKLPSSVSNSADLRVHWTRVVHIADNLLEDSVYGQARMASVYNLLDDLLKVSGGSAETYWMTANRGMQMNIDKEMTLNVGDAEELSAEVEEYQHNLRRFIRTRGVDLKELGNKVADPSNTFTTIVSLIAASTRIPQRILIGSEAGQLASEQDRANWAERVVERRANFAQPHALTPFIQAFQRMNILPQDDTVTYEWPEAFILAPLERAQTSAQKARSATNLAKTIVEQPDLLTVDEARAIIGFGDVEQLIAGTVNKPGNTPSTLRQRQRQQKQTKQTVSQSQE
ncbi:MAG: phage portal protein [Nitrospira sp.]